MAIVKTLRIDYDSPRSVVWFSGSLDSGYKFSVGIPIAHIAAQFDEQASQMGYIGEPMCQGVVTIEGFFDSVKTPVAKRAKDAAMKRVAEQAAHYATSAANRVMGGARRGSSHALPAISAQGLAGWHAAKVASKATGQAQQQIAANVRKMMQNPTSPLARVTLAALHSVKA